MDGFEGFGSLFGGSFAAIHIIPVDSTPCRLVAIEIRRAATEATNLLARLNRRAASLT
jgi:hypothetical protein